MDETIDMAKQSMAFREVLPDDGEALPMVDAAAEAALEEALRLVATKKKIKSIRARLTKAMLELVDAVETSSKPDWTRRQHETWLHIECGLSRGDMRTYREFGSKLGAHKEVLANKLVSFDTVKSMVAADAETRELALRRIAEDGVVDPREISDMRTIKRTVTRTDEEHMLEVRRRHFTRVSKSIGADLFRVLESSASSILERLVSFQTDYFPPTDPFDDEPAEPVDFTGYDQRHAEIVELASAAMPLFAAVFGDDHRPVEKWDWFSADRPQDLKLAMAAEALRILKRGNFGRNEGFDFAGECDVGSPELVDAIAYLAGRSLARTERTMLRPRRNSNLTVLELCAGGGGQALGFMGAGFETLGLVDNKRDAARTLRKNWPGWNVAALNLKSPKAMKWIESFRGSVDVIASGVPCQSFSKRGKHRGEHDDRQLFDQVKDFIKVVGPRAFVFENVLGFREAPHLAFRTRLFAELEGIGYNVYTFKMAASDYGLAQGRVRVVIVGIHRDHDKGFKPPTLVQPYRGTLVDHVGDIVRQHMEAIVERSYPRGTPDFERLTDEWFTWWAGKAISGPTPTILRNWTAQDPKTIERWFRVGFDLEKMVDDVADEVFVSTTTPLPLSLQVLKRLQGFPDGWTFSGDFKEKILQIANAFPPTMARTVALCVRSALTGEIFDLAEQAVRPVVNECLIGHGKSFSAPAKLRGRPRKAAPKPDISLWDRPFHRFGPGPVDQELVRKRREIVEFYFGPGGRVPRLGWWPPELNSRLTDMPWRRRLMQAQSQSDMKPD
ncbi:DNA cytosine methyltransferase [Rhizobium laguerreae]|uniref:DNA cytosine methyltransferase n=1 Tax=Rhizobium laguerreae TaxID=1076926 RepID=UPI001C919D1F|nr:DNA cytosine methyltransferase [Rhizobium laguerreae]MBY3048731.1 DNA cytosine methyltransferase [Rhizobium laguerreae]